jgi:Family of unknown function (DUF6510)
LAADFDGNAIAGLLRETFGTELTDARGTCASCGNEGPLAETEVWLRGPGAVVRCRVCHGMLMVLVTVRSTTCVDRRGLVALEPR